MVKPKYDPQGLKEKVEDALLLFVDFVYALVFWQIVSETYDKIVFGDTHNFTGWAQVIWKILSIAYLFYFLAWDWLHARILTLKNPYKGYARFFTEIIIAVLDFGAVTALIKGSVFTLLFIGLILGVGANWAQKTKRDYPRSRDIKELKIIIRSHYLGCLVMILLFLVAWPMEWFFGFRLIGFLAVLGWLFILSYEVEIPRISGIVAGPGVLFLSREDVKWFRDLETKLKKVLSIRR